MKRSMQVVLACLMTLAVVSVAVAQQPATPVVRIGDWVEVGNEVFMNIIASTDIRYRTTKNYDFETAFRIAWPAATTCPLCRMAGKATLCTQKPVSAWTCGIKKACNCRCCLNNSRFLMAI